MEAEDPWSWDVDRVVIELCTNQRTVSLPPRPKLPEPQTLESAIRKHEVDGWSLLFDPSVVEKGLDIKDYKEGVTINYLIRRLQLSSPAYQRELLEETNSRRTAATSTTLQLQQPSPQSLMEEDDAPHADSDAQYNVHRNVYGNAQAHIVEDASHATRQLDKQGKKQKRLAPTLITSIVDHDKDRTISTQADVVILHNPNNMIPGKVYLDERGARRMAPVPAFAVDLEEAARRRNNPDLHTGGNDGLEAAKKIIENMNSQNCDTASLSSGYLGKHKVDIDDIFYGKVPVGGTLEDEHDNNEDVFKNFCCMSSISEGRRLTRHKYVKAYLKSNRQHIARDGKAFAAIVPYKKRLLTRDHEPSFTLIHNDLSVTRELISAWPELDPESVSQQTCGHKDFNDERRMDIEMRDDIQLGGPESYTNWDESMLEKYKYLQGGDEVLPLYGESGSENEFDLETWDEIMDEHEGKVVVSQKESKGRGLTDDEINTAIDEGIAQIVIKWHTQKLPKRQASAWKMWHRAHKLNNQRAQIKEAQKQLERLNNDRIMKQRQEILSEHWTRARQVHKQTAIMEPSIIDREDLVHKISILKNRHPPPRPATQEQATTKQRTRDEERDGDAGESLHSDSEVSDDGLGDFVVDEDDEGVTADEHVLKWRGASSSSNEGSLYQSSHETPLDHDMSDAGDGACNTVTLTQRSSTQIKAEPPPSAAKSAFDVIDLVSSSETEKTPKKRSSFVDLVTPQKPFIHPPDISMSAPRGRAQSRTRADTPVVLSDSEVDTLGINGLPVLRDVKGIVKLGRNVWIRRLDRDRLLIAVLGKMTRGRAELYDLLAKVPAETLWENLLDVLESIAAGKLQLPGMESKTFVNYTALLRLFITYLHCKKHDHVNPKISASTATDVRRARSQFHDFLENCIRTLKSLCNIEVDEDEEAPRSANRRVHRSNTIEPVISDDAELSSGDVEPSSSRKKRKRRVVENAQARDQREHEQRRLAEQDERRIALHRKLASSAESVNADQGRVIINDAKREEDGFVYVDEEIGKRIKDHQIKGVRFMWTQIVDGKQGCLLAHTMGLGKTMQSITLLVAIADAARSNDESISSLVPERLKESRTLIICPPTLINNWMDELLTWAPKDRLGHLRKIDASVMPYERLEVIEDWYEGGGVLVIGYEMFRKLVLNKATEKKSSALDPKAHEDVKKWLLEGPNIIIADEAHKLKNASAGVTQATSGFRSRSRIALTGSPLANNVTEYHSMIDWVAPNYLGPLVEFKAKFVEPIEAGNHIDSSPYDRRQSMKKLNVLSRTLAPKVNRADLSVLRAHLKPKLEFVLIIPLTPLQEDAYRIYVRHMLRTDFEQTKEGQMTTATLWHWIAILRLLCNHPECFKNKLEGIGRFAKRRKTIASDDDILAHDPVDDAAIPPALVAKLQKRFENTKDITDYTLSNKTRLLVQILDESRKAGDKTLVFSHSLPTLDYLQSLCARTGHVTYRLDGATKMQARQGDTKSFNTGTANVYLISTRAGGLGLNLWGANRVVIFDFEFNPIHEEQAIGRAFRLGQTKPVYVYRFMTGSTFEQNLHNTTVFKTQLASKVVDKKHVVNYAKKAAGDYLFEPKVVPQKDLSECKGLDSMVLDKVLEKRIGIVRSIIMTDIFEKPDDESLLTAEEKKEVEQWYTDEQLQRTDPAAYGDLQRQRRAVEQAAQQAAMQVRYAAYVAANPPPNQPTHTTGTAMQQQMGNGPRYTPILPPIQTPRAVTSASLSANAPVSGAGTAIYQPPPRPTQLFSATAIRPPGQANEMKRKEPHQERSDRGAQHLDAEDSATKRRRAAHPTTSNELSNEENPASKPAGNRTTADDGAAKSTGELALALGNSRSLASSFNDHQIAVRPRENRANSVNAPNAYCHFHLSMLTSTTTKTC